jgi:hypothetical protein
MAYAQGHGTRMVLILQLCGDQLAVCWEQVDV